MQEAKKSMREKGIKSEDVKNLPPIEEIHGLDNPIQVVEVNSQRRFDESDIPFDKRASLCFDEFDNFVAKQQSFNDYVSRQLEQSTRMLSHLSACVDRNVNDLKLLSKHASMITTQVEQVLKAQNDLLNDINDNSVRVITRGGKMTQEPLYPEGHPKRIDQDSQGINADTPSHPKKKKDDRNLHVSSPNTITPEEPNDISASDVETQSGDEHEPGDNMDNDVHNNAQPSNDKDVETEPRVNPDNPQPKRYNKNDFTARKHGKEREPWVQRPMPFPPKPSKKKDDEDFERFIEMLRLVFLQMRLIDMLKMSLYAKYKKYIVTNKRKIPDPEISTMLANYTFKGGTPKKLGDPGVPTIPCSIKGNYIKSKMSSQESVRENNLPQVYGEVNADLKRMEAKERLPKETKGKTKEKNQSWDEAQSAFNKEEVEEVDFLQPYLHLLSPSLIELLRFCETTRARNTYLTREVVLQEKHITDLQRINLILMALLESKIATTPPPSPPKEDN
ncbi:hypothetical protein ZWY2020_013670 [Hordeum vulgare]|nr:hypothetical protein ZWY2020_013670 [Hordeum vulgare]